MSAAITSRYCECRTPDECDRSPGCKRHYTDSQPKSAAYTPPVGMKSLERKLMQNGDGTHLDPEWAEVRVVMRERTALLTGRRGAS